MVISIAWRIFGNKIIVVSSILSWGMGDAAAALVGTKFGKRKIYEKKTLEGTLAGYVASFLTLVIIFLISRLMPWYFAVLTSVVVATAVSVTELYTPNGLDTFTCPTASLLVTIPLLLLFGVLA